MMMCRDEVLHCMLNIESWSIVFAIKDRRCSIIHWSTHSFSFLVLDHPLAKEKDNDKCHHYNGADNLTFEAIQDEFAI
jgi:hypothetical protein